jgi:predicted Zn-dependent protease with MMP-like domain
MTPDDFPADRFHLLVDEAIASLPKRFRDAMVNMAIIVEDEPSLDQLEQVEVEPPDTIYGLYEGIPLPERQWAHGNVLPDKISIFRLPILEDSEDEDDIVVGIGETLIHEVGHYFGLSEEEIMDIEERYWRGEVNE